MNSDGTFSMIAICEHCGGMHGGQCPRVKSIEYHESGAVKRVEYHPTYASQPQPPLVPLLKVTCETPAA